MTRSGDDPRIVGGVKRVGRGTRFRSTPPPLSRLVTSSVAPMMMTMMMIMMMLARVAAHPDLVDDDVCGDAAHPTTKRHHPAPVHDGTISFLLSWAAPDGSNEPQPDEDAPMRRIPPVRATSKKLKLCFSLFALPTTRALPQRHS